MPKWGFSKGDYFFDKTKNVIAKGLSSVKYMGEDVAEELYQLAHNSFHPRFVDVLKDIDANSSLDARQLDILIRIDFFSEYGNQRELMRISDMFFNVFKRGEAKKILREKVAGTPLEEIISKYSVGVTKSGGEAKSYTLLDVDSILRETEDAIMALHLDDLSDILKVRNFADVMGYVGYVSGKEEDRQKLYVMEVFPIHRKKDKAQIGYNLITKSIGSGKESRISVFNELYNKEPVSKNDIIYLKGFKTDGRFFTATAYSKVY